VESQKFKAGVSSRILVVEVGSLIGDRCLAFSNWC
jgi:hypothetical protein